MRRVMQQTLNAPSAADQTSQEAGTDKLKFVSPAVQHYHPSAAKAYAHVLMSGLVPVLITGYNIASVSGPAAGMNRFEFTNPVSSTFYSVNAIAITTSGGAGSEQVWPTVGLLTSLSFVVFVRQGTGALTSSAVGINVAVHGDL